MSEQPRNAGPIRTFFAALNTWFKLLLLAIGFLAMLAVAWAIYCQGQKEIGEREWAEMRTELVGKGEKLEWIDFAPEPVPDEENFMETPFLVGVAYKEFGDPVMRRRLNSQTVGELTIHFRSPDQPDAVDWAAIATTMQTNLAPGQPFRSTASPGMILEYLAPQAADIDELRAAARRPHSKFRFDPTNGMDSMLPNFVATRILAQRHAVSATANASAGCGREALDDLRVNLALARAHATEPTLVAFMIGTAIEGLTVGVVRHGLAEHVWDDRQLVELDLLLRRIDLPAGLAPAFRRERAGVNRIFERDDPRLYSTLDQFNLPPAVNRLAARLQPEGWKLRAQAAYNQTFQSVFIEPAEAAVAAGKRPDPQPARDLAKELQNARHPRDWILGMTIPNFSRAIEVTYKHQTWINEARLAIALERFRMRNDRLPDALSTLVPDYLDALPPDIVTGEPLRYRLTEDHFLIWSVGWNEVDEDGAVGDGQDVGDWVWFGF